MARLKRKVEITEEELGLILEALGDATFYRDTRALVLKMAVRRAARRGPASDTDREDHQAKARAYEALAIKLRSNRD